MASAASSRGFNDDLAATQLGAIKMDRPRSRVQNWPLVNVSDVICLPAEL